MSSVFVSSLVSNTVKRSLALNQDNNSSYQIIIINYPVLDIKNYFCRLIDQPYYNADYFLCLKT